MSQFLDRLNLRPQERRVLVVVLTLILLVINAVFIWPHFKDWPKSKTDLARARTTLKSYQDEVGRISDYQAKLNKFEGKGTAVLPAEYALQLTRNVQDQAIAHGVTVANVRTVPPTVNTSTNSFFDEQGVIIQVNTGDQQLVDFLVALGTGESMIRVRDIDLRADPPQFKLIANMTLVATYQKNPKAEPRVTKPQPPAKNHSLTKKKT